LVDAVNPYLLDGSDSMTMRSSVSFLKTDSTESMLSVVPLSLLLRESSTGRRRVPWGDHSSSSLRNSEDCQRSQSSSRSIRRPPSRQLARET
jgi:hypothetical protein